MSRIVSYPSHKGAKAGTVCHSLDLTQGVVDWKPKTRVFSPEAPSNSLAIVARTLRLRDQSKADVAFLDGDDAGHDSKGVELMVSAIKALKPRFGPGRRVIPRFAKRPLVVVGLAVSLAAASLIGGVGTANAHGPVHTYWSGGIFWNTVVWGGPAYMDWNRVYRLPGPDARFALWYANNQGHIFQYSSDRWSNPFWHNQASSDYHTARCVYNEDGTHYLAYSSTCQFQH